MVKGEENWFLEKKQQCEQNTRSSKLKSDLVTKTKIHRRTSLEICVFLFGT